MARTPSTMLPLGTQAPPFSLVDTDSNSVSNQDFSHQAGLVVMFISNHCPFVIHLKEALAAFGHDYGDRIGIVAIGSNDTEKYPQDGPDEMRSDRAEYGYPFPYVFDADQAVAKAYRAACTPDFYLFDADQRLVYRGQFDGSRPGNSVSATGRDLRAACDALLAGQAALDEQMPSLGCNIKWIPGNEPDYFG